MICPDIRLWVVVEGRIVAAKAVFKTPVAMRG